MLRLQCLVAGLFRNRAAVARAPIPMHKTQLVRRHHDGPTYPFDNMPFSVGSRYAVTLLFGLFFGSGLWAPFMIVWYSMAKKGM